MGAPCGVRHVARGAARQTHVHQCAAGSANARRKRAGLGILLFTAAGKSSATTRGFAYATLKDTASDVGCLVFGPVPSLVTVQKVALCQSRPPSMHGSKRPPVRPSMELTTSYYQSTTHMRAAARPQCGPGLWSMCGAGGRGVLEEAGSAGHMAACPRVARWACLDNPLHAGAQALRERERAVTRANPLVRGTRITHVGLPCDRLPPTWVRVSSQDAVALRLHKPCSKPRHIRSNPHSNW